MKNTVLTSKLEQTLQTVFQNLSDSHQVQQAWQNYFRTYDYFVKVLEEAQSISVQIPNQATQKVIKAGHFEFSRIEIIPVFIIYLSEHTRFNERIGKKYQFDIAKYLLKSHAIPFNHGLFIFCSPSLRALRISFVHSEFTDTKRKLNYYKRFSFYVADHLPNTTFLKQFGNCDFSSVEKIKQAFALEPVTKEFYQLLENWYYRALKQVKFPPDAENQPNGRNIQIIRFITRLVFVWFMKAKGIIPEKIFQENELKNILNDELNPESSSFYLAILQNLFFATLNTPVEQRKFRRENKRPGYNPDYMNHGVFRHHSLVKDTKIFETLFKDIPFLNGGLFDCLDMDKKDKSNPTGKEIRIDGFSDKKSKQPVFPNHLLFNNDPKNLGLINILKTFHFTIDENSPIDAEVALDPELLGNIFENLLASYNPETADTARKATGSFYTPREVVDYMCKESILHYLMNHTHIQKEKLEDLIAFSEDALENFTPKEKEEVVQSLLHTKILDPACGSGAFPMGMLHRMLWILQKIDPQGEIFKKIKLAPLLHVQQNITDIQHNPELQLLFKQLEQKLQEKTDDYNRKLHLIENCIYGIDIQPIAVQIAKLRFFISLLVDEEVDSTQPNANLHPLPNLDMKFIVANTLIGLQHETPFLEQFLADLRNLMHRYFECHTRTEKETIRNEFYALRNKIHQQAQDWSDTALAHAIEQFDPFNTDVVHQWFDPILMFGEKEGFDIIIGNPPYIQLQKEGGKLAKLYENQNYQTFARTGDIYTLFYEKGMQLLKNQGLLCYITSNKWMRAGYGEKLRQFFTQYNSMLLIDLGPGVFENATVDTNILFIQKTTNQNQLKALTLQKTDRQSIEEQVKQNSVLLNKLTKDAWFIGSNAEQRLKEKIERIGKPLKDWDVKIYRGILTGLNEAFIITTEKRNEILANCYNEEERKRTEAIIKPILRGRDIKRYYYEWAGLWVIVIPAGWTNQYRNNIDAEQFIYEQYPSLMNHLKTFEEKAKKRDDKGDYWWELRKCAYYGEFEKEKVVYSEIVRQPQFYYDCDKFYIEATVFLMTGSKIKYICGLLNSNPVSYFFKTWFAGGGLGEEGYRYKKAFLEKLPIPPLTQKNQMIVNQIEELADKIIATRKQNKNTDTTEWEREIDRLVYALYDLTEEEIAIVEKNDKI